MASRPRRRTPDHESHWRYQEQGSRGLLWVMWHRKSLVLVGLATGLLFGSLYYFRSKPVYLATAKIHVLKKQSLPMSLTGGDPRMAYMDDYLATHQELIKSPLIVQEAIKKGKFKESANTILDGLKVTRDKDSTGNFNNILNLSYRGMVAEDCPRVLDAVIDSYKDYLDNTYKNVSDNTVKLINQAKTEIEVNMAAKEKEYDGLRKKYNKAARVLSRGKEGETAAQDPLSQILSRRGTLVIREAEIKGYLKAIEKAREEKTDRKTLLGMIADFSKKAAVESNDSGTNQQLLALKLQEDQLLETYGPDHPQVQSLRKRIERTRQFLQSPEAALKDLAGAPREKAPAAPKDPVEAYVASLQRDLKEIEINKRTLDELIRTEYGDPEQLAEYESRDNRLRRDIARSEEFLSVVLKRLNEIDIVRDLGGYEAQAIYPPSDAARIAPNAVPVFLPSIFFGLLGGLGLAYLVDITDKSFRSPDDIRRRLGLQVVGHIPYLKSDDAAEVNGTHPTLCTLTHPRSLDAEAYRGVRTALFFATRGQGNRVIQITSPYKGDGKSTLSSNLAVSIAQTDKKILLIEGDFRRPSLHRIFGLKREVGLASVIAGQAELPDAIQETAIPGLGVLLCGPIPANPAELLTSPRFQEILETLRQKYDFVLIDTPPLLAVTDPCIVAGRVDGVLLTIRVFKNGRPGSERAREILNTLGTSVVGVVVNGVGEEGVAGYSSRYYRYTYGYGYGYKHGYQYTAEDEHAGQGQEMIAAGSESGKRNGKAKNRRRRRSQPFQRNLVQRFLDWW